MFDTIKYPFSGYIFGPNNYKQTSNQERNMHVPINV